MLNFLDAPHLRNMQRGLDLTWQRIEVTGQNISNINTPHYKAKKLEFENLLLEKIAEFRNNNLYSHQMRNAGARGQERLARELAAVKPEIRTDNSTETRIDVNNVDIDHENLQMSKQKMLYDFLVQRTVGAYNMLRHAISEGR